MTLNTEYLCRCIIPIFIYLLLFFSRSFPISRKRAAFSRLWSAETKLVYYRVFWSGVFNNFLLPSLAKCGIDSLKNNGSKIEGSQGNRSETTIIPRTRSQEIAKIVSVGWIVALNSALKRSQDCSWWGWWRISQGDKNKNVWLERRDWCKHKIEYLWGEVIWLR